MSQKPNDKKPIAKKRSSVWNNAMNFFLAGCFGELFLLLVRKYYIYGNADQVLAWDAYLVGILYAGLALAVAGAAALAVFRKTAGRKRSISWIVCGAGVFLALTGWMARTYYSTAVTFLCVVMPAVMLLGILWSLYDRACAWSLTILGCGMVALWISRKGLHTVYWHNRVLAGVVAAMALAALAALAFYRADQHDGTLGRLRLLPPEGDPLAVYIACGVTVAALALSMISAAVAYYAILAVAMVIFAIAAYYTVKQL
jgi:hypothetical protein